MLKQHIFYQVHFQGVGPIKQVATLKYLLLLLLSKREMRGHKLYISLHVNTIRSGPQQLGPSKRVSYS